MYLHFRWIRGDGATTEEKSSIRQRQLLKPYQRTDANQFLRNGFYQDSTVATLGAYYIVAAKSHWEAPLKSHDEVSSVQFYVPPPMPEPPSGKDAEILELTKTTCSNLGFPVMNQPSLQDLTQAVNGMEAILAQTAHPGVDMNSMLERIQQARGLIQDAQPTSSISEYRQQMERLIREGGDPSRSSALHASVAYDNCDIVSCILGLDRSTVNSRDFNDVTPLMIAAESMAGKKTNAGYLNDNAIIDLLVEYGADKDETNRQGLTAYGMFVKSHNETGNMLFAMTGGNIGGNGTIGYEALKAKLMPSRGPTNADLTGGDSEDIGIIHYEDDDESYDY